MSKLPDSSLPSERDRNALRADAYQATRYFEHIDVTNSKSTLKLYFPIVQMTCEDIANTLIEFLPNSKL